MKASRFVNPRFTNRVLRNLRDALPARRSPRKRSDMDHADKRPWHPKHRFHNPIRIHIAGIRAAIFILRAIVPEILARSCRGTIYRALFVSTHHLGSLPWQAQQFVVWHSLVAGPILPTSRRPRQAAHIFWRGL